MVVLDDRHELLHILQRPAQLRATLVLLIHNIPSCNRWHKILSSIYRKNVADLHQKCFILMSSKRPCDGGSTAVLHSEGSVPEIQVKTFVPDVQLFVFFTILWCQYLSLTASGIATSR